MVRVSPSNNRRQAFAEGPIDLRDLQVAVIGAGCLGAAAACSLADRGVGRLSLIDRAVLRSEDVRGHVCGSSHIGRPRTEALAAELRDRFPTLSVQPQTPFCCLKRPDRLRAQIRQADLVLVTARNEGLRRLVDTVAWELSQPALYSDACGNAGSVLILVDPTTTPCLACALTALGDQSGTPKGGRWNGTASIGEDELACIQPAAGLLAGVAIACLEARAGHPERLEEFRQGTDSVWRHAVRTVPEWGGLGPWQLQTVPVGSRPACAQCCGTGLRLAAEPAPARANGRNGQVSAAGRCGRVA